MPNMPDRPEWMTNMDERILGVLDRSRRVKVDGMWLTPKSIALALEANPDYVGRRLQSLLDNGYVENQDTSTLYRITDRGLNHIQSARG